jgi:hypothetical protein
MIRHCAAVASSLTLGFSNGSSSSSDTGAGAAHGSNIDALFAVRLALLRLRICLVMRNATIPMSASAPTMIPTS